MRATNRVTVNDLLEVVATRTQVKSSLGGQLEKVQQAQAPEGSRTVSYTDDQGAMHVKAQAVFTVELNEQGIINQANTYRCVEALGRQQTVKWAPTDVLQHFARKTRLKAGSVALCVLRAYQPWHNDVQGTGAWRGKERGLHEVYQWMRSVNPALPPWDTGKAREAAAGMLADADIVAIEWVELWNQKNGFKDWMGVPEFALRYGIPERTVRQWIKAGELKAVMVKDKWRIDVSEMDAPSE